MATMLDLFGDYAHSFSAEVLTKDWSSNQLIALSEIAQAKGKRIVESSETGEGKKLAEALVKRMTGNDSVTAKFYHKDPFSYIPQFVMFIVTNHKPEISGTDEAIWRRIKYVPFNVSIPADKQDKRLLQKLKGEYSGILTWIVKGCLLWQKEGLNDPPEFSSAKDKYRKESDIIGIFLEDKCVFEEGLVMSSSDLYKRYNEWCQENGLNPLSQNQFSPKIESRGFKKSKATNGDFKGSMVWHGIGRKVAIRKR
jgi:putative DNA primase/helicase